VNVAQPVTTSNRAVAARVLYVLFFVILASFSSVDGGTTFPTETVPR